LKVFLSRISLNGLIINKLEKSYYVVFYFNLIRINLSGNLYFELPEWINLIVRKYVTVFK